MTKRLRPSPSSLQQSQSGRSRSGRGWSSLRQNSRSRRGFGAALFRRLGTLATERGYGRLELTALDWNEPAIEFYRRFGAQPMAEWTTWRIDLE